MELQTILCAIGLAALTLVYIFGPWVLTRKIPATPNERQKANLSNFWAGSTKEEVSTGPFDCIADAILEGAGELGLQKGETIYVGREIPFQPHATLEAKAPATGYHTLEHLNDLSHNQGNRLSTYLTKNLHEWLEGNSLNASHLVINTDFFEIVEIQGYTVGKPILD